MKTIKEQIDDIASDICDNYCKYRAEAFLGKSVIKELRLGLKIDKKLHKNRDK